MRRFVPVLAAAIFTACEGPVIPPESIGDIYDFRLVTTPPEVLRWPSGTRVRVYAEDAAGARAGQLSGSLATGVVVWNRHALYGEYELVPVASVNDADVLLRWSDEPSPVDMSECPPVVSIAVTTFCRADADRTRLKVFPLLAGGGGGVRFVITILGTQSGSGETVERLVIHELGHALGIGRHSPHPQDLMAEGVPTRATLSQRDISTVQVLYHTRPHITP
ncbi:MAG: matrixin family metalloprotease [Gemmatimonadetes bacterium]|nr:matrixin family metalloprotease [Gemmatimonadota bacterium]